MQAINGRYPEGRAPAALREQGRWDSGTGHAQPPLPLAALGESSRHLAPG